MKTIKYKKTFTKGLLIGISVEVSIEVDGRYISEYLAGWRRCGDKEGFTVEVLSIQ